VSVNPETIVVPFAVFVERRDRRRRRIADDTPQRAPIDPADPAARSPMPRPQPTAVQSAIALPKRLADPDR